MFSCLYEGLVRHRRMEPVGHAFSYGLSLIYLDLDELPGLLRSRDRLLYGSRFSPGSFCRGDHLGDPARPLSEAVRDLVQSKTETRPEGPIRLLTQLRRFGYYFSPLNLYYCFDRQGARPEAVVAEVSNMPWREQHCYVLWAGNRAQSAGRLQFRHPKRFHVSPFMDMDFDYVWRLSRPAEKLTVYLGNEKGGRRVFDASMVLHRRPLDRRELVRSWVRYPWMTAQVVLAIYYQALRLWMKKCPFHPHPKYRSLPRGA
jgi:DUF1365 family protein